MAILLVRHAEAVSERNELEDAARWLSVAGREQARQVAAAVRDEGVMPTRILTSPLVRAVQTAELFAGILGFRGAVESLPALSYEEPPERAARELGAYDDHERIAAFGHMPTITAIAGRLTGGSHTRGLGLAEALWIDAGRVVWSRQPR